MAISTNNSSKQSQRESGSVLSETMSISWWQQVIKGKEISTHMEHWFASAAIIQNNFFDHLPCNIPQMPLLDLSPQSFLPSDNDFKVITNDYIYIVFQILTRHLTFLKKFKPFTAELKMTYGQRTVI